MKKILIFLTLMLVFVRTSYGQITLGVQPSCTSYTLTATSTGLTPVASGITGDDIWSAVIPIGFTFTFYGVPYTQCIIGANGEIGFDLSNATSTNTYQINGNLASSASGGSSDIENLIAGPWCDILISQGGTIMYSTVGTAPNRKFEVTFCGAHMFSCTAQFTTSQIIIYEGTNIAEVHLGHKSICTAWNSGGAAIIGVVNSTGSSSTTAPNRDWNPVWSANNEAWQFTPNAGGTSYTVASIPYAPIPYAASAFYWYDSATHAYLGTGPTLPVAPVVNTTYAAGALGCADTTWAYITVAGVGTVGGLAGAPVIRDITYTNPTLCGLCNGSITLYGIIPNQTDTVFWTMNGTPQPPFIRTAGYDSTITMTGLCPGTYGYYVKVGMCPSNTQTATIIQPSPIQASFSEVTHLGCNGDTAVLTNTTTPTGLHYYWNYGDGPGYDSTNFSPTHVYMDAPLNHVGTYSILLGYNTSYDPACMTYDTLVVDFNHPIDAHITSVDTSVCLNTPMTFTGTTVSPARPSYTWNFGDNTPNATTAEAEHTYADARDYTVTYTVKDTIGCVAVDSQHVHVVYISVRTPIADTSVCLRDSMAMRAYVTVEPATVSYNATWEPVNNIGDNAYTATGDGNFSTNFFGIGDFVYTFTATVSYPFCFATDTEAVHSYPPVTFTNLTASQNIPWGGSVQLNALGAEYYTWAPNNGTLDNPNINNPVATPIDSVTKYTVYGMSIYGCLDSASMTITMGDNMPQLVPSAFTPNGDGLNDVFRITKLSFQRLVEFRIFNRWGQQVFQTNNPEKGWDGTFNGVPQDMGVFSYEITVGLVNGTIKTYKGTVTLIR